MIVENLLCFEWQELQQLMDLPPSPGTYCLPLGFYSWDALQEAGVEWHALPPTSFEEDTLAGAPQRQS